jgi:hypothetical protein
MTDETRDAPEMAEEMEGAATAMAGLTDVDQAAATLGAAEDTATLDAGGAGGVDLTREVDAENTAARRAQLAEVVADAGIVDVAEGAALLAVSDDIKAISGVVGLMSTEDLETGLEMARTAGELRAVSDVVDLMEMPVLAVEGAAVADLDAEEATEGLVWYAESDGLAQRSDGLAAYGMAYSIGLAARGAAQMAIAGGAAGTARGLVEESVAEAVVGAAKLAAADTMGAAVGALAKTSEP